MSLGARHLRREDPRGRRENDGAFDESAYARDAAEMADFELMDLVINENDFAPDKLVSILYFAGMSISADTIQQQVSDYYKENKLPRLTEVSS